MNSLYGSEDLFENGWASEHPPLHAALVYVPPAASAPAPILSKVPDQYRDIYRALHDSVLTVSDLQTHVFSPLTTENFLSAYHSSRIIDILYDHSLLPPSTETNFYHVLGLAALEMDAAGSGDFVTLQFRLNLGLPPLPDAAASALLNGVSNDTPDILANHTVSADLERDSADALDPLSSQLAGSHLSDQPSFDNNELGLADHSALSIDPDLTAPETIHVNDFAYISKHLAEIRDKFKPLVDEGETIKIKEVPEKEGLLFKHINYAITHNVLLGMNSAAGTKKVIRRYSDFVWLLEYLLKKYPFRVIPGLPPKKFTGMSFVSRSDIHTNTNNLVGASPDSQFLQRRRRGLHRFLNQLVRHPVLKSEPIVVTFLSVPTDLALWRKQARIDYALEFKGEKILTAFINSVWPTMGDEFLRNWKNAEQNVPKLIETWTKTVMLVERHEKRQQQIAFDNGKFVEMITKFAELDDTLYPHRVTENKMIATMNVDDTSAINDSLSSISAFFDKTSTLLIDESYIINTSILEKFKNFLDYLYSLQELFERSKRLLINTIPQLQQRIKENEQKHEKLSKDDVDIKGSELVKLRQTIVNDKQEMFQQLNKDWLIKKCCFEEFVMFQETQFLISEAWREWCRERFRFQEKFTGLHENLHNEISTDMPTER